MPLIRLSYFVAKPSNFDYIASLPQRLPGAAIAIEFRHPSWVRDEAQRTETMKFLRSQRLYYTSIDAPEDDSIVPSFIEATGDPSRNLLGRIGDLALIHKHLTLATRVRATYKDGVAMSRAVQSEVGTTP